MHWVGWKTLPVTSNYKCDRSILCRVVTGDRAGDLWPHTLHWRHTWASWRLKSPAVRLFVQQLALANRKKTWKVCITYVLRKVIRDVNSGGIVLYTHQYSASQLLCTWFAYAVFRCGYEPGGRLNKKDGLTRYGDSHVKDKTSKRPSYL